MTSVIQGVLKFLSKQLSTVENLTLISQSLLVVWGLKTAYSNTAFQTQVMTVLLDNQLLQLFGNSEVK